MAIRAHPSPHWGNMKGRPPDLPCPVGREGCAPPTRSRTLDLSSRDIISCASPPISREVEIVWQMVRLLRPRRHCGTHLPLLTRLRCCWCCRSATAAPAPASDSAVLKLAHAQRPREEQSFDCRPRRSRSPCQPVRATVNAANARTFAYPARTGSPARTPCSRTHRSPSPSDRTRES
jgi:hypothetical protein